MDKKEQVDRGDPNCEIDTCKLKSELSDMTSSGISQSLEQG